MPITPTYPGVYIEELPSSVRTITTVGTSITAFVGAAVRGPINKAVRLQNFAAFERRFVDARLLCLTRQDGAGKAGRHGRGNGFQKSAAGGARACVGTVPHRSS